MKKILIVCVCVAVGLILIVILFFAYPWIQITTGSLIGRTPSKPEIIYFEFPFKLVYKVYGEQIIVEDTLICEYNGIGWGFDQGYYYKWKGNLASGNERVTVYVENNINIVENDSNKIITYREIYFTIGNPKIYMGDYDPEMNLYKSITANAILLTKYKEGKNKEITVSPNDLLEKYGIELISWEPSEPILNNFR